MAELEPGHPDELIRTLHNWLREASDPIGSFPTGTDPVEWVVRRFIAGGSSLLRGSIDELEDCLRQAGEACKAGETAAAAAEIELAASALREPAAVLLEWTVAPQTVVVIA